jgi:molecular chaperone DnaK
VSDEQWRLHEPGYSATSTRDRLNRSALSPDGQLRATLTEAADDTPALVLTEASTDRELFRARGAAGHRARVGFSADGRHLLAAWETDERSLLDVWDI